MSELDDYKFKTEGYIPLGKDKLSSETSLIDTESLGGGNTVPFNCFITMNWYEDCGWGWKVIMNEKSGKPVIFYKINYCEYHSIQSDNRTHVSW